MCYKSTKNLAVGGRNDCEIKKTPLYFGISCKTANFVHRYDKLKSGHT